MSDKTKGMMILVWEDRKVEAYGIKWSSFACLIATLQKDKDWCRLYPKLSPLTGFYKAF